MKITIDRKSSLPLYRQIVDRIREMIVSGNLPEGFRLPPERRLAEALAVNRSTVLTAYRELKGEGLVDAHVGRGTVVSPVSSAAPVHDPHQNLHWGQLLRDGGLRSEDPQLRDLLAQTERSDVIPLAAGLPAPELMPLTELRQTFNEVLDEEGAAALSYGPTEGHSPLRESLSRWLARRGICCEPEELIVLSGSQQGLDLAARLFLDPGDTVIVEEPTYIGALEVFRRARARIVGISIDDRGMRVDELAGVLDRVRPKLIYTLPTFQNPSGVVLDLERRHQLLELARRHQVAVLEDDPYTELRFEGPSLPSLRALDRSGQVLYLSTFSKALMPGLRLGYLVAPRQVIRHFSLAKQAVDLHTGSLGQFLLDRLLRQGRLEDHLQSLRRAYRRRRDAMAEALTEVDVPGMRWAAPAGGFYFWVRLPEGVDSSRLLGRAMDAGVAFLPGCTCFNENLGQPFARLAFSFAEEDRLREGVFRFADAVRLSAASSVQSAAVAATPTIV